MEFWDIYEGHYNGIRKFVRSMVQDSWAVEDVVQETFARVQERLDRLNDPERVTAWVYRIAYNLCQDHFRARKRHAELALKSAEGSGGQILPSFQKQLEQEQMGQCVQEKIRKLPETQQAVLVLFDIMNFSQGEVAEILEISVANVKVRIHRARKKLRAILEEECRFERDERDVFVCEPVGSQIAGKK